MSSKTKLAESQNTPVIFSGTKPACQNRLAKHSKLSWKGRARKQLILLFREGKSFWGADRAGYPGGDRKGSWYIVRPAVADLLQGCLYSDPGRSKDHAGVSQETLPVRFRQLAQRFILRQSSAVSSTLVIQGIFQ